MGSWEHRLTNKDMDLLTAECAKCGPVELVKSSPRWACKNKVDEYRSEYNQRKKAERATKKANKAPWLHPIYGITLDEIKALKHDRGCFVCGSKENIHLDHDHATGRLRGLLCMAHNTSLGKFKDNIEYLRRAIIYLENETEFMYSD